MKLNAVQLPIDFTISISTSFQEQAGYRAVIQIKLKVNYPGDNSDQFPS